MKNSPATLKKRNALRAEWRRSADRESVPKTVNRVCRDCDAVKPCGWNYTFSQTGLPEYRTRCIDCFRVYSRAILRKHCVSRSAAAVRRRHRAKSRAIAYLGGGCCRCGYDTSPAALTFHHRDRTEKEADVGTMLDWSWTKLKEELDKCDLMCFNCHMVLHYMEKLGEGNSRV